MLSGRLQHSIQIRVVQDSLGDFGGPGLIHGKVGRLNEKET